MLLRSAQVGVLEEVLPAEMEGVVEGEPALRVLQGVQFAGLGAAEDAVWPVASDGWPDKRNRRGRLEAHPWDAITDRSG